MSSQQGAGTPLFHAPDGVGYRLLELPPELLETIESAHPTEIRLEASATSAVLKWGSQSWALRQKNTSNALMLLKPSDKTTATSNQIPQASLEVISTIHDTIELVPEPTDKPTQSTKGKWHEKFAKGR